MKKYPLYLLFIVFTACSTNRFPSQAPSDFKIEYEQGGGMINMYRHITLQKGECSDQGREAGGVEYQYVWQLTDSAELQKLYTRLNELKVFSIPYTNKGQVMDRGGEKLRFNIQGKTYLVDNSGSNFIAKEDAAAFDEAVNSIRGFADKHHTVNILAPQVSQDTTVADTVQPVSEFPVEMPSDFHITYNMGAGFTGFYEVIQLQTGTCTSEGKDQNGTHSSTWKVTANDMKDLYTSLRKHNAFTIRYKQQGKVYDRGGIKLTFTLHSKKYVVSNQDSDFVVEKDLERFNTVTQLIKQFADKFQKH